MFDTVLTLDVRWNGITLEARPRLESGWQRLVGEPPFKLQRIKVKCAQVEDMTDFEFGLFLAVACRQFTDAWNVGMDPGPQQEMLWHEPSPAEPGLF